MINILPVNKTNNIYCISYFPTAPSPLTSSQPPLGRPSCWSTPSRTSTRPCSRRPSGCSAAGTAGAWGGHDGLRAELIGTYFLAGSISSKISKTVFRRKTFKIMFNTLRPRGVPRAATATTWRRWTGAWVPCWRSCMTQGWRRTPSCTSYRTMGDTSRP